MSAAVAAILIFGTVALIAFAAFNAGVIHGRREMEALYRRSLRQQRRVL